MQKNLTTTNGRQAHNITLIAVVAAIYAAITFVIFWHDVLLVR